MNLYLDVINEKERINNFTISEAIYELCNTPAWKDILDPETIAKMLLVQSQYDKRETR